MHSRQTLTQYTPPPPDRQALFATVRADPCDFGSSTLRRALKSRAQARLTATVLALLVAGAAAAGCQQDAPSEPASPSQPPRPQLANLQRDALSYQPATTAAALAQVLWAIDDDELDGELASALRDLASRVAIDLWLGSSAAVLMADADDEALRPVWLERQLQWAPALELLAARRDASSGAAESDEQWFAAVVRPLLRPLVRSPSLGEAARVRLAILNATRFAAPTTVFDPTPADADADYGHTLASLRLAPAAPAALQANTFLALRVLPTLLAMTSGSTVEPVTLALATAQTCPGAMQTLAHSPGADAVLSALTMRCGFACSQGLHLGDDGAPLQPLGPDRHTSCPASDFGLPQATRGDYLGVDNFLAIASLAELARIAEALDTSAPDDPLRTLVQPALDLFRERLHRAVAVGHLPFFAAVGPRGLTLPLQDGVAQPLPPTAAVLVVHQGLLSVAAWPRFAIERGAVVAPGDERFGFPGATLLPLGASAATADVERLRAALDAVRQLPWPTTASAQDVTLVVDHGATLAELTVAFDAARRAGVESIQVATWARHGEDLGRPVATGFGVSIVAPPTRTARVRAADGNTVLFDTLGRPRPIPVFAVRDFLPDVYAAVGAYAAANPALTGLIVEPDPSLPLTTMLELVQALLWLREGDVMESTEQLLAAGPAQGPRGPVHLMAPLYLVLTGR